MRKHKLYSIWSAVPVTYYQKGVKGNLFQRVWHTQKINLATRIIKDIKFKNCLDVGCAIGYMLNQIQKAFPEKKYIGVDVYDKAIKFAQKSYPEISFKIAAADKLPFKDNSFDLSLCYETIEHVEDPEGCLKEIKRVLKKGGVLILAMDSGNWMFRIVWFIWEKTTGKVWDGAHLHPFNHHELEQIILKSGFKMNKFSDSPIKQKLFSHHGMEVVFVLKK